MRKLALLGLVISIAALAGCATVTKTPDEVKATYRQVADLDARQCASDWNTLWLADREYRMNRYITR